jgi:serine-type D-Ala-D-Ala carboxypeptidase/endopeptidase (penicillin-binding protein 4)
MMARRGGACSAPRAALLLALLFTAGCAAGPTPAVTPGPRPSGAVAGLQNDINQLLAASGLEHATWGIFVRSLSRDDVLFALNARKLLLPASNMKVVTMAAAAEKLGWDYAFETRVVVSGPIEGGVLNGDLIVVGTGDPSLDDWDGAAARVFGGWAGELKARGITRIAGRIVGDDNYLDDQILGSGWAWDDLTTSFATSIGALQFNENTSRLMVAPGPSVGEPAHVSIAPGGTGLIVRSAIRTAAADSTASIESRRGAGSSVLELRGSIPAGAAPLVRNVSVYNPTLYYVTALREALVYNGIAVDGAAVDIDDLADVPPVANAALAVSYSSPPLASLAQTMMKMSQNMFAESLFQAIGSRAGVDTVLKQWGIVDSVVVADGSGLSRYNLITPEALAAILTHVYRDERLRESFRAALPIAGQDGTLTGQMKGTAAAGNARAKTGSMSNVRSLSGYVETAAGEPIVFSIIANNYGVPADLIESTTGAIVVRLAEFRR